MKRAVSLVLCLAILLSGCQSATIQQHTEIIPTPAGSIGNNQEYVFEDNTEETSLLPSITPEIPDYDLNDENLLRYLEDLIYSETIKALDSEKYVVEGVSAVYISKEYIDEVMFNSQPNVYFGYTLSELNELFEGTKYIFTLGENGQTVVQELSVIEDTSGETIIKNIAIGTGVILICVVVSVVSAGVGSGAPACAAIFAASAKNGAIMAASGAAMGGVTAGIIRGIQTGDMDEALKAAALAGSDSYKWGAISGAFIGGAKEAMALKAGTKAGLSMNDVAKIQKESQYPMDVIAQFHSVDEYQLYYKEAGLKPLMVSGKTALVPKIDLNYVSELPDGTEVTNLARMRLGYAPIDPLTGKAYQLHHIGQKAGGTLAVLTEEQHLGNPAILNITGKASEINRSAFETVRKNFWMDFANIVANGVV